MPLFSGKKNIGKNIETEMSAGKPKPQSIAIALEVSKRRKKKKMAQGGMVNESAASEHRPMPEEEDKDQHQVSRNSSIKPPMNDSWSSQPERKQAGMGKTFPLKRPKMVPSDAFSTRLRDQEDDFEISSAPNNGPQHQPPQEDNEEEADKSGPEVPALHMKRMAKGGMINEEVSMHDAEEDMVEHPAHFEDDNDQMRPSEDEYMANHFDEGGKVAPNDEEKAKDFKKGFESGGPSMSEMIDGIKSAFKAQGGMISSEDEIEEDHDASMASAIMAKRRKMAEGGKILSHDSIYSDDSDQADISRNADEDANEEDQLSFNALRKENYNESEGLHKLDSPDNSNEHSIELDSDDHDMVSMIRRKMASKRKV